MFLKDFSLPRWAHLFGFQVCYKVVVLYWWFQFSCVNYQSLLKCSEYILIYDELFFYFCHIVILIINLPLHADPVGPNDTANTRDRPILDIDCGADATQWCLSLISYNKLLFPQFQVWRELQQLHLLNYS